MLEAKDLSPVVLCLIAFILLNQVESVVVLIIVVSLMVWVGK